MTETPQPTQPQPKSRLDALAARAGLVLGWERLWPGLAAALTVGAVFLTVSFLGLWLELPRWGRIGGVLLFAAALVVLLAPMLRGGRSSRAERLARLDRDSGLPHRPATALGDNLANSADPATRAIWDLHRKRAEAAAAALRVAAPSPRLVDRDKFALRGLALMAAAAAAFIAGPEKYARTLAAFDWRTQGALSQGYRLDAWIDPPAYTGRPPVILNLREEAAAPAKPGGSRRVSAPAGSAIIVRASEAANLTIETEGALTPADAEKPDAKGAAPQGAASKPAALRQLALKETK